MEKLTRGSVSGLKRMADNWLEVTIVDEVVQLPHSGEFMVRIGTGMERGTR